MKKGGTSCVPDIISIPTPPAPPPPRPSSGPELCCFAPFNRFDLGKSTTCTGLDCFSSHDRSPVIVRRQQIAIYYPVSHEHPNGL